MTGLLSAFQGYFREHSEWWVESLGHREGGPKLLLHSYLQRVVNSGGRIGREYVVGRQRTDLLVEWPLPRDRNPARKSEHVIECKVLRGKSGLKNLTSEGQPQTAAYTDRCGTESGHSLIFDMIPGKTWQERVFRKDPEPVGPPVTVWEM